MVIESKNIKKMTVIAVMCAFAYICTFVLHFKVSFLTFDFKDAIIAVTALMYGPISGLFCSGIVAFIEFITVSDTGVYGLIMNFLSSAAFSCTAGLVYKYRRTFYGAIVSVVASVLSVIAVMLLANLLITPFYMGVSRSDVINIIPTLLLPFNAVKSILNASLTLMIYKPFSIAFSRVSLIEKKSASNNISSIILFICSLAVAAAAVIFFIFYLKGSVYAG